MSAESSRVSLRYKKETEWGVDPGGKFRIVDFTEESFALDKKKERSKKILPTREYAGMVSKTQETTGGFMNPLQNHNTDELFEGVLMSGWDDITGGTGGGKITAGSAASNLDISFVAEASAGAGGTITFGSSITINITKDQWVFVKNTPGGENDGAYIVKSITGNSVTVNSNVVGTSYESLCEISGDTIRNGATLQSYTFERAHMDITKFFQYLGQTVSTLEVTFKPESEIELAFDYVGKEETTSNTSISSPAPDASPDNPYFVTGDNVSGVFIDYVPLDDCLVQELSFNINNQTESKKSIAVFGPCSARIKPIDVTGSITMFFNDLVQYNKYPLDTEFQLAISVADSNGVNYGFTLAKTEFTTGSANAANAEDPVDEPHDFSVSTNGVFTVQICKSVD